MVYNKSRPRFFFFLFISFLPLQVILISLHAHYNRCVSLALTAKCQVHVDISHSPSSDHACLLQTFWYLLFLLSFLHPVIAFLILLFPVCTNTDYFKIPCFSLQRPIFIISFFFIKYYLLYLIALFLIMVYVSCVLIDSCSKHQIDV